MIKLAGRPICRYMGVEPGSTMSATTAIAAAVRILSHARDLPRSHTQGEDLDDATENARKALVLYVEGLREDGRSVDSGVVRRTLANPA